MQWRETPRKAARREEESGEHCYRLKGLVGGSEGDRFPEGLGRTERPPTHCLGVSQPQGRWGSSRGGSLMWRKCPLMVFTGNRAPTSTRTLTYMCTQHPPQHTKKPRSTHTQHPAQVSRVRCFQASGLSTQARKASSSCL